MNEFFRLKSFIKYQWQAKTKYYLHSPFVYQFYLNVLEGNDDDKLKAIHALRKKLSNDNSIVELKDLGTGGLSLRTVADIERRVAVREDYGRVLYRLVKYFKPKQILELGTSIGISSACLALGNQQATITSLEGAPGLIEIAKRAHTELGIKNVTILQSNFDERLPEFLKSQTALGLVFFDGNHRKDATLRYFKLCLEKADAESIFIFDDIHWSPEMYEAWTEIKAHPQITLALDVFQFGICFFRKEKLAKEEFVLRF